jgi:hypothetical protein
VFNVCAIDCTELGPAESTSESDEEECLVPAILDAFSKTRNHGKDVVSDCRGNLVLGPTVFPSDPSHCHLDERGGGRRS